MRRQPEIGSALGLTTAEVVAACDARLAYLRGLRARLVDELVRAQMAVNAGEAPDEIARRLHDSTLSLTTADR